jgi:hypothetical protein
MASAITGTIGMFYLTGVHMRLAVAFANLLFMINGYLFGAWEYVISSGLSIVATGINLWRMKKTATSVCSMTGSRHKREIFLLEHRTARHIVNPANFQWMREPNIIRRTNNVYQKI